MTSPKACPDCKQPPQQQKVTDYAKMDAIELRCPQHGHTAMGSNYAQAVEHWNIYISFTEDSRRAR